MPIDLTTWSFIISIVGLVLSVVTLGIAFWIKQMQSVESRKSIIDQLAISLSTLVTAWYDGLLGLLMPDGLLDLSKRDEFDKRRQFESGLEVILDVLERPEYQFHHRSSPEVRNVIKTAQEFESQAMGFKGPATPAGLASIEPITIGKLGDAHRKVQSAVIELLARE